MRNSGPAGARVTDTTSNPNDANLRDGCACMYACARSRSRRTFDLVKASSPDPNVPPDRYLTSKKMRRVPIDATMSSSPSGQRQFVSRIEKPSDCR